ncbi:MAG: P1 family peptidase [Burkholderiaceae bacterium]|jgi:L-aminopeptidase/D-esterase-like protein|nr:P1 family peptidase [Burkholderiaceae bacterium]
MPAEPIYPGAITDVRGIEAGHCTLAARPTGCSVVLAGAGAVGGVDVRGAAPGTRETDLLDPANLVETVHAVLLTGGSAWGLDAAAGIMRWLETRGIGLAVGSAPGQLVPIVPAAVLFDLYVGDARVRPGADAGFAACQAAAAAEPLMQGNVGAGAGATVGKLFGMARAMKGGVGTASVQVGGVTVGALVAVNALGDVRDPAAGQLLAGARTADGAALLDAPLALLAGKLPQTLPVGRNTTIGVIATDARLTKPQARRLAVAGHDGLARAIAPAHTMSDGDTLFALATGLADAADPPGLTVLSHLAAEAVARACANAAWMAERLAVAGQVLPCARNFCQPSKSA